MIDDMRFSIPPWYKDLREHPEKYYGIVTDDADAFWSARFLHDKIGLQIGGVWLFDDGVYTVPAIADGREPVYIDATVLRDGVKCFSNHNLLCYVNWNEINPNLIAPIPPFNQRFPGSTLMFLTSLYDYKPGKKNDKEKELLLVVDSFYDGVFNAGGRYKDINRQWLWTLDLQDELWHILENNPKEYFDNLASVWSTDKTFHIVDGRLQYGDDGDDARQYANFLPTEELKLQFNTRIYRGAMIDPKYRYEGRTPVAKDLVEIAVRNKIFGYAETRKGRGWLTYTM